MPWWNFFFFDHYEHLMKTCKGWSVGCLSLCSVTGTNNHCTVKKIFYHQTSLDNLFQWLVQHFVHQLHVQISEHMRQILSIISNISVTHGKKQCNRFMIPDLITTFGLKEKKAWHHKTTSVVLWLASVAVGSLLLHVQ